MINTHTYYKIAFLGILFLAITRIASDAAFSIARPIYDNLYYIDLDGSFLYITVHHIIQALCALLLIYLISLFAAIPLKDFGFTCNELSYAIRTVLKFCLFWFIFQGSIALAMRLSGIMINSFPFPLTIKNFITYFAFQILLSGTSEELLFRSLVITPLLVFSTRRGISERKSKIIAGLIATVIFMLAHINFTLVPFRVTYFNLLQQLTCLVFGIFYTFLFLRTRSIIGSMLAHNLLNAVIVLIGLIVKILS
ncbi:CPBP family intramembrane glutamic endopeptidase [Gracilinema caldarium]|uniref:CPBP family intramembrane glutamic endopeptidase n=1 Tax=Gracilinema caldarium TaxID=215591 RepID=UPI0026EA868A|nr:CPBP family intramembrane glutamic endopeptidase [Gracilinema caldarium]